MVNLAQIIARLQALEIADVQFLVFTSYFTAPCGKCVLCMLKSRLIT